MSGSRQPLAWCSGPNLPKKIHAGNTQHWLEKPLGIWVPAIRRRNLTVAKVGSFDERDAERSWLSQLRLATEYKGRSSRKNIPYGNAPLFYLKFIGKTSLMETLMSYEYDQI